MTRQQILADVFRESKPLFLRFLKGFDQNNCTAQAPSLPNHAAWTLGHLAIVLARSAAKLDGAPLPESDFAETHSPERFAISSVGFGSNPLADPSLYPTFDRCRAIFEAAYDRLTLAITNASDAQLDAPSQYGKMEIPTWQSIPRMISHNGMHAGQLVDLRRALGMDRVVG